MIENNNENCPTGIPGFDELLQGGFPRGSTILLIGHPGAGKTTFAAKFIYEGAKRYREKGIYFSFYESKQSFFKNMKTLGMNFEEIEKNNLFKYINILPAADKDFAEVFTNIYMKSIKEFKPIRLVIDSITPVLEVLTNEEARSFFRTVLFQRIPRHNITKIIVADLPYGEETIHLGGIEFIVDGVIIMKTRITEGLITRWMEIRKMRRRAIPMGEIPFSISEDVGIRILAPLRPETVPAPSLEIVYSSGCKPLDEAIGGIPKGAQILLIHPPRFRAHVELLIMSLNSILKNRLRTLFITYSLPEDIICQAIKQIARALNINEKEIRELILVRSINPSAHSIPEMMARIWSFIDESKPDLLILHGLRTIFDIHGVTKEVISYYLNNVLMLRKRGITAIYQYAAIYPNEYVAAIEYSDIVLAIVTNSKGQYVLKILKTLCRGKIGAELKLSDIEKCIEASLRDAMVM